MTSSVEVDGEQRTPDGRGPGRGSHLVIAVHGIRTFGEWQERLTGLLGTADASIEVRRYKYGYFSAVAFLLPPVRFLETLRFRAWLQALVAGRQWDRIDIVAHSFGTHIVSWALRGMKPTQRPEVHTLILAGSVLKPNFRWYALLGRGVKRVINECGIHDAILLLSQIFPLFTGMAGRLGFYGMTGEALVNRFHRFGHGGYFLKDGCPSDDFMRERWVPLLTSNRPAPPWDERGRLTALRGLGMFLANNVEPIKLAVYTVPLLLLVLWIFVQWQQAIATSLAAESTAVRDQEPDLALLLSRHAYLVADNEETRGALYGTIQNARWIQGYLRGHERDVAGVAFSRDGRRLASVQKTEGGKVILWDADTGRQIDVYPRDEPRPEFGPRLVTGGGYKRVAFAPDDRTLMLWRESELEIVETNSWRTVDKRAYRGDIALHHATGKEAYLTDRHAVLDVRRPSSRDYLWEGEQIRELAFTKDGGTLIAFGPEKILLQGTTRQRIDEQDQESKFSKLPTGIVLPASGTKKAAVSDDKTLVAAIGFDRGQREERVKIWDSTSGSLRHDVPAPHEWLGADIAFWPRRNLLVSAGGGGTTGGHSIGVWDPRSGRYLGPLLKGLTHTTTTVAFSQDGRRLASGDNAGTIILWDFGTPVNPHFGLQLVISRERTSAVAPSPAGPTLAAATASGLVLIYDFHEQRVLQQIDRHRGKQIAALAYGPGGARLYIALSDGTLDAWDTKQRRSVVLRKIVLEGKPVRLEPHPRHKLLLLVSESGESRVVDADTLETRFSRSEKWGPAVAFHPSERHLFSVEKGLFAYLSIWDIETNSKVRRFILPEIAARVVPRPDGERLALVQGLDVLYLPRKSTSLLSQGAAQPASDNSLRAASLPQAAVLKGHRNPIYGVTFSPQGKWLATGGAQLAPVSRPDPIDVEREILTRQYNDVQEVFLWSGESGRALGKPLAIPGPSLKDLRFGDGGRKLFSLSASGELILWDVDPCNWAARALHIAKRDFTISERSRYLSHASWLYRALDWTRKLVSRIPLVGDARLCQAM